MNNKLQGWTLSETLVMMIVAGVVFLAVMDGIVLSTRYANLKTKQITANMRLYEGYYLLEYLTATADSASAGGQNIRLLRDSTIVAELFDADSVLVARRGFRTDTLMEGISELRLVETRAQTGADTIKLRVHEQGGDGLRISFPVKMADDELVVKNLREREKQYAYE